MRDYKTEFENRVNFVKRLLERTGAKGIVYGNSGGKDCTLVGIICKSACENTLGVIMPCFSKRNYEEDRIDALKVAQKYDIETKIVDLTEVKRAELKSLEKVVSLTDSASSNINPRLRMTTLYAIGAAENRLVAGTGNKSEIYMGYFTKWGDGGCDFNPISDLTATEVFEFLRYLDAPKEIIEKAPSAGLFEGQTDEKDMGITYADIDNFLETGYATEENKQILARYHDSSEHKRTMPVFYENSL